MEIQLEMRMRRLGVRRSAVSKDIRYPQVEEMAAIRPSDIDMVFHVVILFLLVYGFYRFKVLHKLMDHGIIFTVATLFNIGTILVLMVPHLIDKIVPTVDLNLEFLIIMVHIAIGTIAVVLSAFIVIRWYRNGKDLSKCKGKALMRTTFITWTVALLMGMGLYLFG